MLAYLFYDAVLVLDVDPIVPVSVDAQLQAGRKWRRRAHVSDMKCFTEDCLRLRNRHSLLDKSGLHRWPSTPLASTAQQTDHEQAKDQTSASFTCHATPAFTASGTAIAPDQM